MSRSDRPVSGHVDPAALAGQSGAAARTIPNLLTVAGVDPSGGAGVLADIKTFSALGAYGCAVICALTAQNTRAVTGIEGVSTDFIRLQIDTLFDDVRIDSAKLGMLGTAAIARTVADALEPLLASGQLPALVVDPVMVSKGGDVLLPASSRPTCPRPRCCWISPPPTMWRACAGWPSGCAACWPMPTGAGCCSRAATCRATRWTCSSMAIG